MSSSVQSTWLKLSLESDATFGRGDGVAGVVDAEVQHDDYGLPYLGGRTLKGLLGAECAEILFALEQIRPHDLDAWRAAASFLFGSPGSRNVEMGRLRVGDARLPEDLRLAITRDFQSLTPEQWGLERRATLESLTALRSQTAMDARTGAPLEETLRSMRVIRRDVVFVARLDLPVAAPDQARWLLAASVRAFRRAGSGRHRGRGRLRTDLFDRDPRDEPGPQALDWFQRFAEEVHRAGADLSAPAR